MRRPPIASAPGLSCRPRERTPSRAPLAVPPSRPGTPLAHGTHQQSSHHSSSHTASELVRLASSCLGLAFTECDSYYRGTCHRADSPDSEIEIQPNPIPGDDGEDDLYATEHPTVQVLLLTTTPAPNPALRAQLAAIEGLAHLQHESW